MMDPKLSVSWDSYQKSICNGFSFLQQRGEFVDMTIAADGHYVKVHQMVMSLVSPYIKELVTSTQCQHPVIFLNRVSFETLQLILEYAYTGEVLLPRDNLPEFLEACGVLHIKGLEDGSIKITADRAVLSQAGSESTEAHTDPPTATLNQTSLDFEQQIDRHNSLEAEYADEQHLDDSELNGGDSMEELEETEGDSQVLASRSYLLASRSQLPASRSQLPASRSQLPASRSQLLASRSQQLVSKHKQQAASTTTVQYSLSCQGSIMIILNRYLYRLRYSRKNDRKMWRCADYFRKKCPAYVVTKGDYVLERGCAHSHPFHDRQILRRVQKGHVFSHSTSAEKFAALAAASGAALHEDD